MAVPQEVLDAIDAEQEKVRAALKIHDYDAMAETFTEDCQFIAPGSPTIKGRAGVKMAMENFGNAGITDFDFRPKENQLLGKYVFRSGELTMLKGSTKVDVANFAQIWRKDADGQYRHWFEMINSQTPPTAPSS